MFKGRTDLALEAHQQAREIEQTEISGVNSEEEGDDDVRITRVRITSQEAADKLGKPVGTYITIEAPALLQNDAQICRRTSEAIKNELSALISDINPSLTMVAGLGNSDITPDSIGPKTIRSLLITRHLFAEFSAEFTEGLSPVCAVAPGVLGITGIETGEIVKGIIDRVKPNLLIAVDALASRSMHRVSTTVQIANTGISPGSGVGNRRQSLTQQDLGIPVIAIGVPMVVDAISIAADAVDDILEKSGTHMDENQKYNMISETFRNNSMIVTPKDIDAIAERISNVLSQGINQALQPNIPIDEINELIG